MSKPETSTRLSVDYFDGQRAKAHRVSMWIENGMLQLSGRELIRQVPMSKVDWPERTRYGARQAHFADGGSVQALRESDWDDWLKAHRPDEALVVRVQQSWRWTMLATVLLLMVTVMGYWWGLPLAARAITPFIPTTVDKQIGSTALHAMDAQWLKPSKLSQADQASWRGRFEQATSRYLARQKQAQPATSFQWYFRQAPIGPNAFALPDGSIVVTDELIALLQDREDVLLGVLGHEVGHVTLRHGMRTLIQTGLLGAATSVALGDFSSVLAGAPALIGHLAYSRDFEREADDAAISFMRANDIRPSVMVELFQRLASYRLAHESKGAASNADSDAKANAAPIGIAFSSHPADRERIARFKAADLNAPTPTDASQP